MKALKFEERHNTDDRMNLMNCLPQRLKMGLTIKMN